MRKRNYELWNRETNEKIKIKPKDMTRLFSSPMVFSAARLKIGESIDFNRSKLTCIH